jgi:hypothetical protein
MENFFASSFYKNRYEYNKVKEIDLCQKIAKFKKGEVLKHQKIACKSG